MPFSLHLGDCLEVMQYIPDKSVDLVLCDLPYGTTACAWDSVIPFGELWAEYRRVAKPRAAIVLTASQPFTTMLAMSNIAELKYQWVWKKVRPSNPQLAKIQPLKVHEDILVFGRGKLTYNPQGLREIPASERKVHAPEASSLGHCSRKPYTQTHTGYPNSVVSFPSERGLHPTQKPVALFRYLIRTYTQPGELVLDPCVGSGTTALAAREEGRNFICGDTSAEYVAIAQKRLDAPYTPSFLNMLEAAP